jgi:hypothetical protein
MTGSRSGAGSTAVEAGMPGGRGRTIEAVCQGNAAGLRPAQPFPRRTAEQKIRKGAPRENRGLWAEGPGIASQSMIKKPAAIRSERSCRGRPPK